MKKNYNAKTNAENLGKIFGENLKKVLKAKGITYEDFAFLVNVEPRAVAYWIQGKKFPSLVHSVLICEELKISLDSLVKE